MTNHNDKEARRHNTGLAKVAVQCSADTFLANLKLVLDNNFCDKNRSFAKEKW